MKKHGNEQPPKNSNKVLKKTDPFSNLDQKSMQTQNLKPRFFTGIQTRNLRSKPLFRSNPPHFSHSRQSRNNYHAG